MPAILRSLADDPGVAADDLASLDEVWSGGDACPDSIEADFRARFGLALHGTYGLTEAPTVISIDDRGRPAGGGASGRPLPHVRVTIRDGADREVAAGELGEVCVEPMDEGPYAGLYRPMLGYLHKPEATAEALRAGRLRTGDLGVREPSGHLRIRSRRSSLIIRGGANVYPAEVERVISEEPDVVSCVVFGLDDERLGQRVMAAVEPRPGADEEAVVAAVEARCRSNLARYKVPEQVAVVAALPRNAMGKVDRSRLTELLATTDQA